MSTVTFIRKDDIAAYERWQPNAFSAKPQPRPAQPAAAELPTVEQIEKLQQQARDEGHAAGYNEGKARAAAEANQLHQILSGLQQELDRFDETVTQEVLALAIDLARQILCQALRVRPELIVPVVEKALRCLPQFNQPAHVLVHPEDASIIRAHMGERLEHAEWKIVEDPQIARGGCRIETANGQIDATLATRWQQVLAALGQTSEWME
jgi:flagellar assembly protein FliH